MMFIIIKRKLRITSPYVPWHAWPHPHAMAPTIHMLFLIGSHPSQIPMSIFFLDITWSNSHGFFNTLDPTVMISSLNEARETITTVRFTRTIDFIASQVSLSRVCLLSYPYHTNRGSCIGLTLSPNRVLDIHALNLFDKLIFYL